MVQFKLPVNDSKYYWTNHVKGKMAFYNIPPSRVKRVIKFPHRVEEGVALDTFASMQLTGSSKKPQEIWVMYQIKKKTRRAKPLLKGDEADILQKLSEDELTFIQALKPQIIIISAWRYPGISPKKAEIPIPDDIKKVFGL